MIDDIYMEISRPTVSIIIPFYNRIEWVKEAIESTLNQTYDNFEVILIDDGSTDTVEDILEIQDKRIRYYRQDNKGVSSARNTGIGLAKGEYIAFLDSDDLFMPEKLEIQLEVLRKNPEVGLVHSSYFQINESGDIIREINTSKMTGDVFPSILYRNQIATPTVMVKKNAISNVPGFKEDILIGEDILFWAEIAKHYSFIWIEKCLSKVRIHSTSTSVSLGSLLSGNKNVLSNLHLFNSLRLTQLILVKVMLKINIILITTLMIIDKFLSKHFNSNVIKLIKGNPLLMKLFGNIKIIQLH